MASMIRTFKEGSYEYEQLRIAAEMMTEQSPRGFRYYVADTYFDYGQDWMWTTILGISNSNLVTTFQALNPRQQEEIILTNDTRKVVNEYFSDKWCIDK